MVYCTTITLSGGCTYKVKCIGIQSPVFVQCFDVKKVKKPIDKISGQGERE